MHELIDFDGCVEEAEGWLKDAENALCDLPSRIEELSENPRLASLEAARKEALARFKVAYDALKAVREPLIQFIEQEKHVEKEQASWEP